MRFLIFILFVYPVFSAVSQEPITWSASYLKNEKKIVFEASLEKEWHLYSQFIDPAAGPVPTQFSFENQEGLKLIGSVVEPAPIVSFDKSFEAEVAYFENNVRFEQQIEVKKRLDVNVRVTYMLCNNEMCLPPNERLLTITVYP